MMCYPSKLVKGTKSPIRMSNEIAKINQSIKVSKKTEWKKRSRSGFGSPSPLWYHLIFFGEVGMKLNTMHNLSEKLSNKGNVLWALPRIIYCMHI
jgi:hypothetical protein